jgi:predicted nuclease with TOPRIM domain
MPKYKEYFKRMLEENKQLFEDFRKLHDKYALNEDELQEEFNKKGEKVLTIVRFWENRLCKNSETGGYGSFTTKLAEKFQNELRKEFPKIDNVGLIVEKFDIKKISLN